MCLFLWRKRTETRTKDAHWSLSIGKVASDLKISNAWHKGGCVGVHVHSVHCVIKPFGGNWGLIITTKITPLGWLWWWTLDQKYYRGAVTLSKREKSLKWKSQPKNRKSLPPLWRFLFLPLAQKGHFWCVCFCREKNGKGGRYTPIGHDSFAMWLLFYKLEMLQTKVGCLGVHGYCVHSMSNLFSSKGSFLVFSLALREDT